MFSKNNIKYILILALGFFWCSSVYLTQEQYLTGVASVNTINIIELLFGSLSMALGIIVFGMLYKKNRNVRMYYFIFIFLSIVSMITFFATKNLILMGICMCLTCLLGTAGFGAGYHFSLLASNVEKQYRGRCFAIGYGLGSIGTYLLVMLPESFYSSVSALSLYIPIILLNLFFVLKYARLEKIKEEKSTIDFKNYFTKISIIVLAMSLLSALSTDIISLYTINLSGGYGNTRVYYCLGLIVAGILADKNKNLFDISIIISFIFSLLAVILLKDNYSINIIAALSYSFIGFFVLFRTMSFINMVETRRGIIYASAFGLMYSRIMEGLMVLFEDQLLSNYTILIVVMSITLSLVIILYFLLYFQKNNTTNDDAIKSLSIKYNLSSQEEKILELLVQNKNNQEIANELFLSIYTVKNHVASIYKKTNMSRKEIKEKIYLDCK